MTLARIFNGACSTIACIQVERRRVTSVIEQLSNHPPFVLQIRASARLRIAARGGDEGLNSAYDSRQNSADIPDPASLCHPLHPRRRKPAAHRVTCSAR